MAEILATGQVSIVDLTDNHTLSGYIATNMPRMQVYDPENGGSVVPDWAASPGLT